MSRSIPMSPLDFEITRVDCIYKENIHYTIQAVRKPCITCETAYCSPLQALSVYAVNVFL